MEQVGSDPSGKGYWKLTISETSAGDTSEVTITNVPKVGRVLRQTCVRTAGTGTTVDPILGTVADPASNGASVVYENGTAGSPINNDINAGAGTVYTTSTGTLYHRSRPNSAAADHSITSTYLIQGGW